MNILIDKKLKKSFLYLGLVLILGVLIGQVIIYINIMDIKNEIIRHDYRVAGYLYEKIPEKSFEIKESFTAYKNEYYFIKGKNLLEQTGYTENIKLYFVPEIKNIYTKYIIIVLVLSIIFCITILYIIYAFLNNHYRKIDEYIEDVNQVMDGDVSVKLDDYGEGSLAKLAASVNIIIGSLHTHFIDEKKHRLFLKDILTNVSHQLKTPLSALIMYNEIMKDEKTENKVIDKFLFKSENELSRMKNLIFNLLKLAKLDAGIMQLKREKYILNEIIDKVLESFEEKFKKENKTFEFKSGKKVDFICDREWMFEAISNLVKNALEYTREGNHIAIKLEKTPLLIKIIVEDNGVGIHKEDINHIFKRFYRSKFSQNKQGTGIGLSLSKAIIEMHNGYILVERLNQGAKFTINLPILQKCKNKFIKE